MLILADDFTGACDAAGSFGATRSTVIVTTPPREWPPDVDVLSVDLDLRERSPSDAFVTIESAARALGRACRVFVKIDSTLRGPVAALVRGALQGSARSLAMIAPAFPEQGRCVIEGRLVVNGQPGPRVADVLGDVPHVIVDADNPEALRELAQTARHHPEWLLVGSAGLARHLGPVGQPARVAVTGNGPVLVVAGSPSPVTRQQLEPLSRLGDVVVLATLPTDTRDSGQAAAALAESAHHLRPRAAVLTGGATARAIIHRVGARHIRLLGELEPGIPVGVLEDGVWHGLTVVTKAGGFGSPSTLLDVVRALGPSSS